MFITWNIPLKPITSYYCHQANQRKDILTCLPFAKFPLLQSTQKGQKIQIEITTKTKLDYRTQTIPEIITMVKTMHWIIESGTTDSIIQCRNCKLLHNYFKIVKSQKKNEHLSENGQYSPAFKRYYSLSINGNKKN